MSVQRDADKSEGVKQCLSFTFCVEEKFLHEVSY